MKILQLCSRVPYPHKDGYSIAVNAISKGLDKAGHEVRIMSLNTLQHHVNYDDLPQDYINEFKPILVDIDTFVRPVPAFLNIFSNKSYNVVRFISKNFKEELFELLSNENFDIVQFDSLFTTPYLETVRKYSKAKAILRAHNVENLIWDRRTTQEKNPIRKWYLKLLSERLRKYEGKIINQFDGIAAISDIDKKYLIEMGCKLPIDTVPIGIDFNFLNRKFPEPEPQTLFFIGILDWMPNVDGLLWFLNDVWHIVHERFPNVKFYIAGRHYEKIAAKLDYPNVIVLGEVEDAYDYISSKEIMLVPLRYASGTRVKIIEALALGKLIITTSVGVEGIEAVHSENIMIADTPLTFADSISRCLREPDLCKNISNNARKFAQERFNNDIIIDNLIRFYKSFLSQ
ncbi:MAG: hypothetical protein A2X61_02965 [Ignavibacteria bacterium GWB2_35_12]|nr:MAG: hypothetical protein A2X61_02965 [Ignavibacteria bacterium GWB2_35_12]OGU95474.1 MAG: hypothetical protein A2220_07140 [Ignavibacteria bacterium RIFOXYA2_FULL_35_10]OGV20809.1 MAG: hypothetical protein A2475_11580 [Ignavibacteria bacterium RIFOXYC2_FULL_35_21]